VVLHSTHLHDDSNVFCDSAMNIRYFLEQRSNKVTNCVFILIEIRLHRLRRVFNLILLYEKFIRIDCVLYRSVNSTGKKGIRKRVDEDLR